MAVKMTECRYGNMSLGVMKQDDGSYNEILTISVIKPGFSRDAKGNLQLDAPTSLNVSGKAIYPFLAMVKGFDDKLLKDFKAKAIKEANEV